MIWRLRYLVQYLFRRHDLEEQLDEEVRCLFEMMVERHIEAGLTPEVARRHARMEFGGLEHVKDSTRDRMAGNRVHSFFQDVRYAWRSLRRSPSFAFISLLTLALGIGVNTAIFSIFYGVLLHPLPFDRPEELMRIWAPFRQARAPLSGAMLAEIERRNRVFSAVAGLWVIEPRTLTGDRPEQLKTVRVTANLFDVLGVRAARGRSFTPEDRGTPAVMLTDSAFRRRFGGDPAVLGKSFPTQEGEAVIVGILPPGFQLQFAPDANIPADLELFEPFDSNLPKMSGRALRIVGRLKPGVGMLQAQRDLDRVAGEIRAVLPLQDKDFHMQTAGLQADAFADVAPALKALFAGAAFVLIICCVNVSSLLLARAGDRRKEIALRLSLGASRGRILQQLFAEGLLLCVLGGACGVAVGWAGFRGLLAIRPDRLARIADSGLSWPSLVFAAAASLAAAILFALAPAFESLEMDLFTTLRAAGRGWMGRLPRRAGAALVIGEIALGFVLVTGAATMAQTLSRIEQSHPGFEAKRVLTFQLPVGFDVSERRATLEWQADLSSIPGVERVGAVSHLPLDLDLPNYYGPYKPQGAPPDRSSAWIADFRAITPGYFVAMGIRLIEGRPIELRDQAEAPPIAVVDEVVAHGAGRVSRQSEGSWSFRERNERLSGSWNT